MEQKIKLLTGTHNEICDITAHLGENNHSDHYISRIRAVCFINEITLHLHTLSLIANFNQMRKVW